VWVFVCVMCAVGGTWPFGIVFAAIQYRTPSAREMSSNTSSAGGHGGDGIPNALKDFVFDMYQASRVSFFRNDVDSAYDMYKEICDRFFANAPWPDASKIAPECNMDKHFLLFYRCVAGSCFVMYFFKEMMLRVMFSLQRNGHASQDENT
jgi:hypothetical protein